MGFRDDKKERTEHYNKFILGWKSIKCGACNGSGYYDNTGSPKCGCCDGTGKTKVSPEKYKEHVKMIKEIYGKEWKKEV